MSQYHTLYDSQSISIFHEVVSTDIEDAERSAIEFVYQIIPQIAPFVQASAQLTITHKDEIANTMNTVSGLFRKLSIALSRRSLLPR